MEAVEAFMGVGFHCACWAGAADVRAGWRGTAGGCADAAGSGFGILAGMPLTESSIGVSVGVVAVFVAAFEARAGLSSEGEVALFTVRLRTIFCVVSILSAPIVSAMTFFGLPLFFTASEDILSGVDRKRRRGWVEG